MSDLNLNLWTLFKLSYPHSTQTLCEVLSFNLTLALSPPVCCMLWKMNLAEGRCNLKSFQFICQSVMKRFCQMNQLIIPLPFHFFLRLAVLKCCLGLQVLQVVLKHCFLICRCCVAASWWWNDMNLRRHTSSFF